MSAPINTPPDPDDENEEQAQRLRGPKSLSDLDLDQGAYDHLSSMSGEATDVSRRLDLQAQDGLLMGGIEREGQRFSRQVIGYDRYDERAWERVKQDNPDIEHILAGEIFDEQAKAYIEDEAKRRERAEARAKAITEKAAELTAADPDLDTDAAARLAEQEIGPDDSPVEWPYPQELGFDMYNALYQTYPERTADLDPRLVINEVAMEMLLDSPEYDELHASTQMDEFSSGIGTSVLAEKVVNDERFKRAAQALAEQAEPTQAKGESDEDFAKRLAAYNKAQSAARRAMRQALSQATKAAQQGVEDANMAADAFGMGPGLSDFKDHTLTANAAEKMKLARKVLQNEQLRRIAQFAGRFRNLASQAQRSRVKSTPDEVYSITQGNDLSRMLPSELLRLSEPTLRGAFFRDFVEQRVPQYELNRPAKEMRGPIIVAIDESGSMSGTPDAWAKAAFLALYGIAHAQGRDLRIIHFASGSQLRTDDFLHATSEVVTVDYNNEKQVRPISAEVVMEVALYFFCGGTDFDPWMGRALESVDMSQWNKADVVLISDGEAYISDEMLTRWKQTKEQRKFRAYGILISDYGGGKQVEAVTDAYTILRHSALGDAERDSDTLLDMFGI